MKDPVAELRQHLIAEEKTASIMKRLVIEGVCHVDRNFRVVPESSARVDKRISLSRRGELLVEEMLPLEGDPGK